ncbi:MAG TPA: hypothetical protein VKR53_06815, partial [Puia sp.]|nr:hypothetical protein [Puia sp.]
MNKLLFIFLLFSFYISNAQYNPDKIAKSAIKLYVKARDQATAGSANFPQVIALLREAVKIDSNYEEAYLSLGGIFQELKNYNEAILNFEKAKNIDSNYFLDYNLSYSICLAGKGEFNKALN